MVVSRTQGRRLRQESGRWMVVSQTQGRRLRQKVRGLDGGQPDTGTEAMRASPAVGSGVQP